MKQKWKNNPETYMDSIDQITSGLKSKESQEKRNKYFSSELHKQRARAQALKLAEKRKSGLIKPIPKTSNTKPELAVESILKSFNINYQKQYPVGPYLFDFYLTDLKLLLEVQGEYWHSLPKNIANDLAKSTYVKRHTNVTIKYISEIETKSLNLKRIILDLIDFKPTITDFDIKSTIVKDVDPIKAISFMQQHHYLPRFRKTTRVTHGVFLNDILIAVIIYGQSSYDLSHKFNLKQNQILELSRFVIDPKYQKKNLASRSISQSVKLIKKLDKFHLIFSFADPHFGHSGTIYKASNWIYDGQTRPSYYYKDPNGNIIHKKTLWDHAQKMKKSEDQYAKDNNYIKISTEPKERYIKWLKKQVLIHSKTVQDIITTSCKCGKERTLKRKSLKRSIKKYGHYLCHSCSLKEKWKDPTYKKNNLLGKLLGCKLPEEIIAKCNNCESTHKIKRNTYKSNLRKNGHYLCHSCAIIKWSNLKYG